MRQRRGQWLLSQFREAWHAPGPGVRKGVLGNGSRRRVLFYPEGTNTYTAVLGPGTPTPGCFACIKSHSGGNLKCTLDPKRDGEIASGRFGMPMGASALVFCPFTRKRMGHVVWTTRERRRSFKSTVGDRECRLVFA